MLHPSYTELIDKINSRAKEGEPLIQSRYSIVTATAERAKQIIDWKSTNEKIEKRINMDSQGEVPEATKKEIYSLVVGKPHIEDYEDRKPLSIAVEELFNGSVKIVEG